MEENDWTARVEELLALQSICSDDFQFIGVEGGSETCSPLDLAELLEAEASRFDGCSLRCQLLVHLQAAWPVSVVFGGHSGHGDDGEQAGASISVKHLPPLCLHLLLRPGYPAHALPHIEVLATWLSQQKLTSLCEKLLQLGADLLGMPLIFEWQQWLQEEALDYLQLGQKRIWLSSLEPTNTADGEPSTSIADGASEASTEQLLVQLHRYNTVREVQAFQSGMWTCGICLEELPGVQCMKLPGCGHFFCLSCMQQHTRVAVRDGALASLACPAIKCRRPLEPQVLRSLLTDEDFARWEDLTLSRTLDRMSDLVYCPRCNAACLEDEDHCAQCPECMYVFCGMCSDGWHPGSACMNTAARVAILKKRSQQSSASDAGKNAAANAMNELKSLEMLKHSSKQCPVCKMGITKNGGCNKVHCLTCNTKFCWVCMDKIDGYSHFRDADSRCFLFEQQEIDEWNAMVNANMGPRDGGYHAFLPGGDLHALALDAGFWSIQGTKCPQCRQENAKTNNNNHIRCWACGSYYCYLCRKVLGGGAKDRSGGKHFSSKGCRQHSAD